MSYEQQIILQLLKIIEIKENALKVYAKRSNWGNGGWEGHADDYFKGPEIESRKPWKLAQNALTEKVED